MLERKLNISKNGGKLRKYIKEKDVICMKNSAQLANIMSWYQKFNIFEMDRNAGMPVISGSVVLEGDTQTVISFEHEKYDGIKVEKYRKKGDEYSLFYSATVHSTTDKKGFEISFSMEEDEEATVKHVAFDYLGVLSLMVFMVYFEDKQYVKQKNVVTLKSKTKKKTGNTSTRKLTRTILEISDSPNLNEDLDKGFDIKTYERHVASWTRRGHFRTIKTKDGKKKVWIKPQICFASDHVVGATKQGVYKKKE